LTGSGEDFWTLGRETQEVRLGRNPGLSGGVWDREQDGENLGRRGESGMGVPGWDGIPANKCKRDEEALPGSAVRYRDVGTGWSPGCARGIFYVGRGEGRNAPGVTDNVVRTVAENSRI
jgi:hypothetical protein